MYPQLLGDAAGELFALPFTMPLLNAVLEHDFETHRHLLGSAILATRVAITAGLDRDEAAALGQSALFHDIGKLAVEQTVLTAARPLTEREWEQMKSHAELGEKMLRAHGAPEIARIVRWHHERIDGSGYPDGLRGLAIPWETRLLSVADAYDCLRAGRAYARPVSHEAALDRLSNARHLYDLEAVAALIATFDEPEAPELRP
ncbi:MAG TPA: HD domain-containing phosphohydrolase [Candidatus Elarobacter sp.]|jgi:putative nucleotidyltransferase with HDIG domain